MAELSRLQVKISTEEDLWGDVGFGDNDYYVPTSLEASDQFGSDNAIGIACARYSLQAHFEAITDWVESTGADGIAVSTEYRGVGENSLEFDKISNNKTAMISKTITSLDMSAYSTHSIGHMRTYISDLTDVDYCFVRMGTDSSNYWEWQFSADIMVDGWNDLNVQISAPTSQTGDGMDMSAATWMAFGVVFDNSTDTLADIRTGGWAIKRVLETTQIVSADIQLNSPFLVIKDRNSNNKLDIATGASYNYLYNRNTDGTNLMPAGDADARAIHVDMGANNDVTLATLPDTAAGDLAAMVVDLGTIDADTGNLAAAVVRDAEDFNDGGETDTHQAQGLYLLGFAASATYAKDDAGYGEDQTAGILAVHSRLWDGSGYDRFPGNSSDGALVNLGANNDVAVTGTVDLGAVDNAVLDNIALYTAGAETALEKIDGAIVGSGAPVIDSYTHKSINLSAAANQVLVSSAANKQIWVYGITYTCSVAGTVSFQDEDDLAITGIMDHAANSGLSHPASGNFAMPIWKLGTDKDLEVDVVTAAIDGWLDYAIVSV